MWIFKGPSEGQGKSIASSDHMRERERDTKRREEKREREIRRKWRAEIFFYSYLSGYQSYLINIRKDRIYIKKNIMTLFYCFLYS